MAIIDQTKQPHSGSGPRAETPAEKAGWLALRQFMKGYRPKIAAGGVFFVKGYIKEILLDNGTYFKGEVDDQKNGGKKAWYYVKALCAINDPAVGSEVDLILPPKNVGASFYDGWGKNGRSPIRGGLFNIHLAVTHQEPPKELIDGKAPWDTADYEGPEHPVLLRVKFVGMEQEGSKYFGQRANLTVFLDGIERDMDLAPDDDALFGDDEDPTGPTSGTSTVASTASAETDEWGDVVGEPTEEPKLFRPAGSAGVAARGAVASTATASGTADQRATERQVKFIKAIAREAGLDDLEVQGWSQELFNAPVEELNRRDASALIEALQRRRNEVA